MPDIRIAEPDDHPAVARALALGFHDDPVLSWAFPGPRRAEQLGVFFGFLAREALVPLGATYLADGGCAAWTPPDPEEWPPERGQAFGELMAGVCDGDEMARLGRLVAAMEAAHPPQPHWYLGLIAVEPDSRNRGLGGALLRASLGAVDAATLPAYLESTNPRNVTLYERHGFEATGTIEVHGGPSLTAMWREPVRR
jgi:ribosomal protein S18 acetylase RimI-like enzyme